MYLSGREQRTLASCFALLAQDLGERDIREHMGVQLLELFRADYFASYVWSESARSFIDGVSLNMDPANLARYQAWYQYRDPITFELQARRSATLVDEVMPRESFLRTEFYNDFLARDGLHWGINLHAFDGDRAVGDLRIWRGKRRLASRGHDKELLDLLAPAFTAALRRAFGARALD